jgi:hypothetical protein
MNAARVEERMRLAEAMAYGPSQGDGGLRMPDGGLRLTEQLDLHALVMFVVDATRPFSSPAKLILFEFHGADFSPV